MYCQNCIGKENKIYKLKKKKNMKTDVIKTSFLIYLSKTLFYYDDVERHDWRKICLSIQQVQYCIGAISFHQRKIEKRERERRMILVSPDCLSNSYSSMLFSRNPMLSSHLCFTIRRRTFRTKTSRRLCVASSLITSPESFEVGRLIGSYGFMNITRCTYVQLYSFFFLNTIDQF